MTDRLTCGKKGYPLTNLEYDHYLSTLADVEGLTGLQQEAQRQRALCDDLERQLHEADAREAKNERQREYRRKRTVLVELLTELEEQEAEALRRQVRLLEQIVKDDPEDRFYCPCDRYCRYVGEHRQAPQDRDPFS